MTGEDNHRDQERLGLLVAELAARVARDGDRTELADLVAIHGHEAVLRAIDVLERDALDEVLQIVEGGVS